MQKKTHRYDYELMNTDIVFLFPNIDEQTAKTVAYECYNLIKSIEELISLYGYGTDISMINESPVGVPVKITSTTYDCLKAAMQAYEISKGAIDVTMGEFFLKNKKVDRYGKIAEPHRGKFAFDDENYIVEKLEEGKIDLGAIGKGFALDKAAEVIEDNWEIKDAFVSFGASSIYSIGADENGDPWRVNLSDGVSVPSSGAFVGASGLEVLGEHIIDCRTGKIPQHRAYQAWAFSGSGAISDAMSTAFMILSKEEIANVCSKYNISAALRAEKNAPIEFID